MATTLSYGFTKPVTNDRGPTLFPLLEDNWQQVNDHDHDGSNSAKISSANITATTETLASGSWVSEGSGQYSQTITLPAAYTYDDTAFFVKLETGDVVYPTIEKVSASQYKIYTNDNSLGFVVYYK